MLENRGIRRAGFLLVAGLGGAVAVAAMWLPEPGIARGREAPSAITTEPASGPSRWLGTDPVRVTDGPTLLVARVPIDETPPTAEQIDRWVADLAHDHVRDNASHALGRLWRWRTEARPALVRALASYDHQQRQLAASLLRGCSGTPGPALLDVTVEALADDDLPSERSGESWLYTEVKNAHDATWYLLDHLERARTRLSRAVYSTDGQQALLSAYLLARAGEARDARVYDVLLSRLGDNQIRGDACMAANALYRIGRPALNRVVAAIPGSTGQERALLELIVLDLTDPPRTRRELVARKRLHRASTIYNDPVIEYVLGRPWPW